MNPPEGTILKARWRVAKVEPQPPIYTFVCQDGRELRTSDVELAIRVDALSSLTPAGYRVVGRSGPRVPKDLDAYIVYARNQDGTPSGPHGPGFVKEFIFISRSWEAGCYDILEEIVPAAARCRFGSNVGGALWCPERATHTGESGHLWCEGHAHLTEGDTKIALACQCPSLNAPARCTNRVPADRVSFCTACVGSNCIPDHGKDE